ncbi:MAG: GNAT family N-acetyltransferase [Actinomyces oris]|uniref:GNAT family N-acetyltransferase n=1 Tax=Actinomyces oris TaxID=544580 RepID=UPI00361897BF
MTTDRVQHGAAVRVLVEQDLASEQMLALMREAAGLPDAELCRIIAEELVLMEVVGTGPRGVPTSVAAYVSRPDGVVLEYIAVAPGLRGDGIGRALVDALASVSGQVVAETDDDAVGFYRALDFDIDPAPSDPRWPGRRRYRCVRRS